MKFQIGDKVLIQHSNEEGEVVDIINNKMVMVDVRGVKFPAYIDQLEHPYFKRFSEKKAVPQKKEKQYIDTLKKEKNNSATTYPPGVALLFLPKFETDEFGDDVVVSLKIHLINGNAAGYNFHYQLSYFGKTDFELKNQLAAQKDFYLHDLSFSDLNDSPVFECEFSLITPEKSKAAYYETSLKLKPKQLFQKIEEVKQKGVPTFSYPLFEVYPDKNIEDRVELSPLLAKGYKLYEAAKARQHLPPARSVVDLHIEKLTDNWKHLNNFEILSTQLAEFEKYYELSVAHHQPTLIIIHGLGTGRLRDEIHELLKQKKEVNYFINQYHPSYGYGATEIFFKY